jgi:Spy/CpxP family protein refolding chaperone
MKMFQKIRLSGAALIAVLSVSGAVVVAQEQQAPTTSAPGIQQRNRGDRLARRGKRRQMRGERLSGGLRGLDLTDQQREQARAIMRANFESNKAQIEELKQLRQKGREALTDADKARAKELHKQLHDSRLNARGQLSALLTAEQKLKLEERMKNRRENRERFGRRDRMKQPT